MGETQDFIMKPKIDFCFKELMEEELVRRGFLSALLGVRPEDIVGTELIPTVLRKLHADDKQGILDVRVMLTDGAQVDIEIQVASYKQWPERSLFYLCKMFCEQIRAGDSYEKMKKCIHVGILDFNLFEDSSEYYSRFHLWEDHRNQMYSDKIEVHILELKKVRKNQYLENPLLNWTRFLGSEKREEMETLAEKDVYIDAAYQRLMALSEDERKKLEYDNRMKAIRDYKSFRQDGILEGIERGIKRGSAQKLISMVCKKMVKGKSPETIAEELEEDKETIDRIYTVAGKYAPEYDVDKIYQEIYPE
ncbi:Rpn family recombination-promoting nuclease/putative transposase [Frisingicoccus sp.]|uniref:Rpn family recombination-promoting nuclease/putative transposase n=1 Tax=Frisingicoccus sp. TaxID=1918627 RepID=UPI003AB1C809